VIGFAQLLSDRKDLPEDVMDQLGVIQEGGQRVSSIVKRLLAFARQSKLERSYININDIVESTLKLRSYALETGNITVATRFGDSLPNTMADAGQLQQVFLNLIVNAEQEMEKAHGGGRLEVKTELVGDSIRVLFKDSGPGIAKENLDKVFNPFFTTKEVGAGTGLGLSLSHGIMAEHGGRLYVESEEGEGATFVVELPVTTEGRQYELTEVVVEEKEEKRRGRILVGDDEEIVGNYLSRVLVEAGHQVEVETEAGKALERLEKESFDLILSDIKMPGMGGIEFYQKVKQMRKSLAEKVIFMTGDVMGKDTHSFLEETGLPNITKPFNIKQLKGLVNRVINIR
jgi:CheY-like chemotaxis protein